MAVLYLFDGYNILHAGGFGDRRELVDLLAGFVAVRGARGVVVFDGVGDDAEYGPLEVRFASPADPLIERLAAERRGAEEVWVVSSDRGVWRTAGQETRRMTSNAFLRELAAEHSRRQTTDDERRWQIEGALDAEVRTRLERLRRRRH